MTTQTKLNWSTMNERERDALVAEKVMGRTVNFFNESARPPYYSSNIASAFLVVEQMRKEGFSHMIIGGESELVTVTFAHNQVGVSRGESIAECISLAALRSKGVDV